MGSAGRPTPADFDLSARLGNRGIRASPARLHHLRSEGWIPGPEGPTEGAFVYSADAENYVAELITTLKRRRNLSLATITLFGRGILPPGRALQAAYVSDARSTKRMFRLAAGAARAAERVAAAVARRHERRFIHSAFGRAMSD